SRWSIWRSACNIPGVVPATRIPLSTYRLQFNSRFTFRDARQVVDYLHSLGVTDCYASSYLMAVPGSPHGYDVADPTRLNPEVGSEADYWAWVAALRDHHMGHVLDVVPNHMGIAKSANPWWLDVLENGPSSRFARFFDISWHPVKGELANKLLIPILGDQYGAVLERQELQLTFRDGAFFVKYYDNVLPDALQRLCGALQRHGGPAAQLRSARPVAARTVVPPGALARRVGRDQLPPVLRRERARRTADGGSRNLRRSPRLPVPSGAPRGPDRPADRSRRRSVLPRRLPATPAGQPASRRQRERSGHARRHQHA